MAQTGNGTFHSGTGPVSERIVKAVATVRDVDPIDLPPLYEVIDPDALDRLFPQGETPNRNSASRLIFTMADCTVVVDGTGYIDVTPEEPSAVSSMMDRAEEPDETETTLR